MARLIISSLESLTNGAKSFGTLPSRAALEESAAKVWNASKYSGRQSG